MTYSRIIRAVLFVMALGVSGSAQVNDSATSVLHPIVGSVNPVPLTDSTSGNTPYTLKRGDNEFGCWGGVSFKATTIFAGLHEDEAADRKFVLGAFRYGRTLAANDSVAFQYTLDVVPLAVATGDIVSRTTVGGVTTFRRETAYGAGLTPAAFQLDFANGSKIHPFIHFNGGFPIFTQSVTIEGSAKFPFVGQGGPR